MRASVMPAVAKGADIHLRRAPRNIAGRYIHARAGAEKPTYTQEMERVPIMDEST